MANSMRPAGAYCLPVSCLHFLDPTDLAFGPPKLFALSIYSSSNVRVSDHMSHESLLPSLSTARLVLLERVGSRAVPAASR